MTRTPCYIVYRLTNLVNGKIYIGRTTQSLAIRWRTHQSGIYAPKNVHLKLYKALAAYGIESFKAEAIYEASSFEELKRKESELILAAKSHLDEFGYNMSIDTDQGLELYDTEAIERRRVSMHKAQASRRVAKAGIGVRCYRDRFYSNIRFDGMSYAIGHDSLEAAKTAYDMLAIHFYGDDAVLNDPARQYTTEEISTNHQLHVAALDRTYTSSYWGVHKDANKRRYGACVSKDRHMYHLGFYETERDAAIAVDKARLLLDGRRSNRFNFPELLDTYDPDQLVQWFKTIGENRMRGLSLDRRVQKYGAKAFIDGKLIGLGYYEDPMKAAMIRDMAILFAGSDEILNYPEKVDLYRQDGQYRTIIQTILDGKTKYGRSRVVIKGFDE